MALTLVDHWQAQKYPFGRMLLNAFNDVIGSIVNRWPQLTRLRRPLIISISIAFHIGVIALLIQFGMGQNIDAVKKQAPLKMVMNVFNLSPEDKKDADSASNKAEQNRVVSQDNDPQKTPHQNPIEATQINIKRPEWSVSNLPPSAQGNNSAADNASGNGEGVGDSKGVWDPYAGASPKPRDQNRANQERRAVSTNLDDSVDRRAYEVWMAALKERLPRSKGDMLFSIKINDNGIIESASIVSGNASMQLKLFVQSEILGKKLFMAGLNNTPKSLTVRL